MFETLKLEKGDKVKYLSNFPYTLSNGQKVNKEGQELIVSSDINVQKNYFKKISFKSDGLKQNIENVEKVEEVRIETREEANNEENEENMLNLESMNKEELLSFAEENDLNVDKRKGEVKLREEIKNLLNDK